jgi:hypothetical protein
VTKAELRAEYLRYRGRYADGEFLTNEYALHLDEMLAEYFRMSPVGDQDWEPDS